MKRGVDVHLFVCSVIDWLVAITPKAACWRGGSWIAVHMIIRLLKRWLVDILFVSSVVVLVVMD